MIPNNIKSSICTVPRPWNIRIELEKRAALEMSVTFVANTTALKGIFQRIATQVCVKITVLASMTGNFCDKNNYFATTLLT